VTAWVNSRAAVTCPGNKRGVHLVAVLVIVTLLTGCGNSAPPTRKPVKPADARQEATIKRARCAAAAGNCAAATGRIVYVEAVDPDGDGDLHLVVLGGSVTAPGLSVFDIEAELRPRRDPRIGDMASAAGPVYRGSYGQRQIQATVLHVARR
jgi:hypothetical protein